jgi:glycolate oxidase
MTQNKFKSIDNEDVMVFSNIIGHQNILTSHELMEKYGRDETEDLFFLPEIVLKPCTSAEVSKILAYCNKQLISVTTRGAGTGLSGAALPIHGGVVLSMERFNKIIEIDERNLQATVEPGVITQVFQEEVAKMGLFYPPDPSSRGSSFIGGNVSHNSGGPRALKYGVTRDYVLNLEIVLADGNIIMTGANTLKNSTGYSLTQLMVGSEGTLGVITKIVFKLIPAVTKQLLMLVPFNDASRACEAVSAIFRAGITPSALEFMERDAIDWALKYVEGVSIKVEESVQAHLLIELDGNDEQVLMKEAEKLALVVEQHDAGEMLMAENEAQKNGIWRMRRGVAEAVKSHSVYKEEDTVVPRASLPLLLKEVKKIGRKYGFQSVCYGHAGDGNLHVNIIKGTLSEDTWRKDLPMAIAEIFEVCVALGGTISGEHGIGLVQRDYLPIAMKDGRIEILKGIKNLFDPLGILNAGKIFTTEK